MPGVLDDLYAAGAASAALGTSFDAEQPTLTVWAPTAQSVSLQLWDAGATGDPQVLPATFDATSGAWSVADAAIEAGSEYRWVVEVYAPSTGAIEANSVTDPYSVALTVNSARTVVVDLDDPTLALSSGPRPRPRRRARGRPRDLRAARARLLDHG